MRQNIVKRRNLLLGSDLYRVYNLKEEGGKGRFCMLLSDLLVMLSGQLSGSLFYTRFLLLHGIDKSGIGILAFVPYIACMFSVFSPYILERFQKKKKVLIFGKLTYYFINIVGITLLPSIVQDTSARLFWFVVLIIVGNLVNQLLSPGFTAWHADFLSEDVRVDHFNTTLCVKYMLGCGVPLVVSVVADAMMGTPYETAMLTGIRYVAFLLAVIDCMIWLLPKEYPHPSKTRVNLSNIFVLPVKNRKFLGTILVLCSYYILLYFPRSTWTAYLLEDVGISYTLFNGINTIYFVFFLLFSRIWKKFIMKYMWFRSYAYILFIVSVSTLGFCFVVQGTEWIFIITMLVMHLLGVPLDSVMASMPYVNLPETDRTTYMTFYGIINSGCMFLGSMLGTVAITVWEDVVIRIAGFSFCINQIVFAMAAVGFVVLAVTTLVLEKSLMPDKTNM